MATPKHKQSHSRSHMRKAKWLGALSAPSMTLCKHCGESIMTYHACPACGYYRGRKIMKVAADKVQQESEE